MEFAGSASAIDLRHFKIGPESIGTAGCYQMFSTRDRWTDFRVALHTTMLLHPLEKQSLVIFLQSYFQKVANFLYSVHPIFSCFLGWNIQLGSDE
jgi:hypothetical protein